jgi:hypothetical protein
MKRFTRREEISPAPSRPDVMEEAEFSGSMVPDEGIEPPTFGLQNRCSTAELIRRAAK